MMTTTTTKSEATIPHGTQEWASYNVNIQDGCEHDCRYCYAKSMAIRFKRRTSETWTDTELRQKDIDRTYRERPGRTMFPTSHDITPKNVEYCLVVLMKLLESGNDVLIVSKPRLACIELLCGDLARFKCQIVFRFSIGSADNRVLKYWEPGAPTFQQRLSCLKYAFEQGFETSVSCEPMLDEKIDDVVEAVRPYTTDSIWIGKVNNLAPIIRLNCPGNAVAARRAAALVATQNDDAIRDLYQAYRRDRTIKWKDSIKKVVGLDRPTEIGLDV